MNQPARKLILAGIIICLVGSVFAVSAVYIDGWVDASIDRNYVLGIWLVKVVIATVQSGVAPFGAALAAIGVALHWIGGRTSRDSLDEVRREQGEP